MKHVDDMERTIKQSRLRTSPAVDERILADASAALAQSTQRPVTRQAGFWRRRAAMIMKSRFTKVAAAAAIVLAIGAGIVVLNISNGGTAIAWADVQEKIRNARAVTYRLTVTSRKEGLPDMEMKVMVMEPGLMRHEITKPERGVNITDLRAGKVLSLEENQKKATLMTISGLPEDKRQNQGGQNFLAALKKLIEEAATEVGERQIQGRPAKGYRVDKAGLAMTIWVDAETADLIEVETTAFGGEMKAVMFDFELDKELDEKLFSMEVPEGYTLVKRTLELKPPSAADMVCLLRLWAEVRGGSFPDALSPSEFAKDCKDDKERKDDKQPKDDKADFDKVMKVSRAWVLLQLNPKARYAGRGVKLGDAETAIFWYRPKDSETYTVIYGDLSIKDVAPEDLPEDPAGAD